MNKVLEQKLEWNQNWNEKRKWVTLNFTTSDIIEVIALVEKTPTLRTIKSLARYYDTTPGSILLILETHSKNLIYGINE